MDKQDQIEPTQILETNNMEVEVQQEAAQVPLTSQPADEQREASTQPLLEQIDVVATNKESNFNQIEEEKIQEQNLEQNNEGTQEKQVQQQVSKTKGIKKQKKVNFDTQKQQKSKNQKKMLPKESYNTKLRVCKFLKLYPEQIESIASDPNNNLIAVSRSDSSIELWKTSNWTQYLRFQNSEQEKAIHLIFVELEEGKQTVLVAFCANGIVKLYNFNSLLPCHEYTNTGGHIHGASLNPHTKEILIASEDGFIRVISVDQEYGIKLRFVSSTRSFEERAIDVCWDYDNVDEFYGSYESGLIRKFNKQKQVIATMSAKENNEKTIPWKILSLKNQQLIAGCSDGQLRLFETRFGTVMRSYRRHEADVQALAYNPQLDIFYASGADSKIAAFKCVRGEWILVSEERGQSHDIKSLILIKNGMALLSGGVTTDICQYEILEDGRFADRGGFKKGERKKLRHIVGIDQNVENRLQITQDNLVLLRKAQELQLWQFDSSNLNYQFIFELKTKSPLLSASLSSKGEYIAYSTDSETCIFAITNLSSLHESSSAPKLKKFATLPPSLILRFSEGAQVESSDSQRQFLILLNFKRQLQQIQFSEINFNQQSEIPLQMICTLDQDFSTSQHVVMGPKNRSIFIGSRSQNKIVEIGLSSKNFGKTLFEVPKLSDTACFSHLKVIPNTKQLVVVYDNRKFALFDLISKQLSKWTKDNFNRFPLSFLKRQNPILGVLRHPTAPKRIMLYTQDSLVVVDLSSQAPNIALFHKHNHPEEAVPCVSFTVKEFEKPIFFATEHFSIDKISHEQVPDALSIFQIDFGNMVNSLPGAIMSKKFGK